MKLVIVIFALLLLFGSCKTENQGFIVNEGKIFGTTYRIVYGSRSDKHQSIRSLLDSINISLSVHDPNSVISRVNRGEDSVVADRFFTDVFNRGLLISRETGGAFDMSVAPLVNAWGFGPGGRPANGVNPYVDSLMQFVGMKNFHLEGGIIKSIKSGAKLDAGAIAQGYAADVVADYLVAQGVVNFMVEIGGELTTSGLNQRGIPWQIGIERPIEDTLALEREMKLIVGLSGQSLATSGNYRNFYIRDGKKIAHTIDPRTGYPVSHSLLSASIIASDAMSADAYATACMVLGLDECLRLLDSLEGVEGFLIYHDGTTEQVVYTSWFEQFTR